MFDTVYHHPVTETAIIIYKKLCEYGHAEYAKKMALLAIPSQTKLSDILQLADLIDNQFGSTNRKYYIYLSDCYLPLNSRYDNANLMDILLVMGYRSNDFHLAYEYDGELVDTDNRIAVNVREHYQQYCIERMKSC